MGRLHEVKLGQAQSYNAVENLKNKESIDTMALSLIAGNLEEISLTLAMIYDKMERGKDGIQ